MAGGLRRPVAVPDFRVLGRIVALVVVTRGLLTGVLYFGWSALVAGDPTQRPCVVSHSNYHVPHLLGLWGNWDTSWYLRLAQQGYPSAGTGIGARGWAFFPLYPGAMRVIGAMLGGRTFLAGFLISNAALCAAAYFLYQLMVLESDQATAWRAVKYLLLLPVAFLFSAVLSEAVFLALSIGAFYYARQRRWWIAGAFVALLGATRAGGLILVVPLAVEYLADRRFDVRKLRADVLSFGVAPLGVLAFSAYARHRSGDALVWEHVQFTEWGHVRTNPISTLVSGLTSSYRRFRYTAAFTILWTLVLVAGAVTRRLRVSYLIYGLLVAATTLALGKNLWGGMLRYLVVIFPVAIVLAEVSRRRSVDIALTIGLALLQGGLILLWTACQTYWVV